MLLLLSSSRRPDCGVRALSVCRTLTNCPRVAGGSLLHYPGLWEGLSYQALGKMAALGTPHDKCAP